MDEDEGDLSENSDEESPNELAKIDIEDSAFSKCTHLDHTRKICHECQDGYVVTYDQRKCNDKTGQ